MSDDIGSKETEQNGSGPAKQGKGPRLTQRQRRWAIRSGIGTGVTLILFILVVFVLPTPLAHYVINAQLEELGIRHDGIDTVDVDLWNSEVRAGPVTFRAGEAEDGQIGATGFDYSFGALFQGRAFVQTFYLRGVDVYVSRLEDGAVAINGINLRDLAASEEADAETPPAAKGEEEDSGFGFGGERFEFADSRLVFEDVSGGKLTLDLDRLTLDRLQTWTPEEPTSFELAARLNEIELALDGTIVPLGDPLTVTLNSRVTGITLDRVARFIGPTGLARQAGSVDTEVHYAYAIHRDGKVEGTVDGTYRFDGFDIATESGGSVTLDNATLKVDLRQELRSDGSTSAAGQVTLSGGRLAVANAAGDDLEVGELSATLDGLNFQKGAERRERLLERTPEETAPSDTAPSVVQLLIGWARDLGENALDHRLSVDGAPALTLTDVRLRAAARDGLPGQELRLDEANLRLDDLTSEAFDAGWGASGALDSAISGLRFALLDGSAEAGLAALEADSGSVDLNVTREETTLGFDLAVALQEFTAGDDQGGRVELQRLSLSSAGMRVTETAASGEARGPLSLGLEGLAATLPGEGGDLTLGGESLALALSPLTLTGKQGETGQLSGSLEMTGLSLERGGATPFSFSLAQSRSELQDIRVAPLNAAATVTGGLTTRLSELSARLALSGGETAAATVASLEVPLSQLGYAEESLQAKGAIEVTGLAAGTDGEQAQSLGLASLSVTGLDVDTARGAAAESLALGQLDVKLALPLPGMARGEDVAAKETATATETSESEAVAESPAAPRFDRRYRLGRLTLAPGSAIEVTDRGVEPPLQARVVVEELQAGPLDTAAPEAHSDLTLALSVNETSRLRLDGWAAPLKARPDFQLTSDVEGVPLPILSSYVAKAAGVNIESGELFAGIEAKASDGDLGGGIDLKIDDLFVTPLSEEQAEKLQADIGLPVGFAVSILKDSEGVIAFGLPLGGTVAEPQVDYSEAVDKAIAGAMASVFPTSWFGPDGNSFEMQPAGFVPGTAELTAAGKEVADQMGGLYANKPGISIRACGRAGRADLVALRGGPLEDPEQMPGDTVMPAGEDSQSAALAPPPDKGIGPDADAAGTSDSAAVELPAPSDQEVEALLSLATERGTAVRKYLEARYGIDPGQIPECRTAYSIKDGKPPRAEFQF